jgi:hypothetical protein
MANSTKKVESFYFQQIVEIVKTIEIAINSPCSMFTG